MMRFLSTNFRVNSKERKNSPMKYILLFQLFIIDQQNRLSDVNNNIFCIKFIDLHETKCDSYLNLLRMLQ